MPQDAKLRDLTPEELEELQSSPAQLRDLTQEETDELNLATTKSLQPTLASEAARVGTQFIEGAAALPDLVAEKTGLSEVVPTGVSIKETAERFGVPIGERPQTETGQFAGDVAELAGGGALPAGGFIAKGAKALPVIISEITAALGGAIGGRVADDKMIGELVGSLVGSGLPTATVSLIRRGLRGDAKSAQEALKTLEDAGVTPNAALIAEGGAARPIASAIGKLPFGGKIGQSIRDASEQLGESLDKIVGKGDFSSERVGRVAKKGIEGFVGRFKEKASKLYDKIKVSDEVPVSIENTRNTLNEIAPKIKSIPELGEVFQSETIARMNKAIGENIEMPFGDIRTLRTLIGEKLGGSELIAGASRAELKRLYAAISDDLGVAAKSGGFEKQFNRANQFYKSGVARVDDFLKGVEGKIDEKILPSLLASGKEGATQIRALRKSLTPDEWSFVAKSTLKRLGKETAGEADDFGVGFSAQRLLTNLNKLSPEAQSAFFGGVKGLNENDMKRLAKAAGVLRRTSREGINPSGSAQGVAGVVAASSVLSGNPMAIGAVALTALGADRTSALLTNPAFAKWLSRGSSLPDNLAASHFARLATIADRNPEIAEDINKFLSVLENE